MVAFPCYLAFYTLTTAYNLYHARPPQKQKADGILKGIALKLAIDNMPIGKVAKALTDHVGPIGQKLLLDIFAMYGKELEAAAIDNVEKS